MKKFIITFSISLFLFLNFNIIDAYAEVITLSQGLYNVKESKLSTGINYNVRNVSPGRSMLIVIDSNQMLQQLIRLEANSPKYILKPLNYGDLVIIIGSSNLEFS